MDYSAANTALWNIVIQLGLIAGAILICSMLRNKVKAIRSAMMPVAVMAGFLLLILKYTGLIRIDGEIMSLRQNIFSQSAWNRISGKGPSPPRQVPS